MMLEFLDKVNVQVNGVLHVGAHLGEELKYYRSKNIEHIIFVEANPQLIPSLHRVCNSDPRIKIFNVAAADTNGSIQLHITSSTMSSSVLPLKDHSLMYPDIVHSKSIEVSAKRLDDLFTEYALDRKQYNCLNMDIQGFELAALRGMPEYLKYCDVVYTEVNFREMYSGCVLIDELEGELHKYGFTRKHLIDTKRGWGDALYTKN